MSSIAKAAPLGDEEWAFFTTDSSLTFSCGIGLTPYGYYPCAIAGGIDRVFGFGLGKSALPSPEDDMVDRLQVLCPLCGHFGFALPTKQRQISRSWRHAYEKIASGHTGRPADARMFLIGKQ